MRWTTRRAHCDVDKMPMRAPRMDRVCRDLRMMIGDDSSGVVNGKKGEMDGGESKENRRLVLLRIE